jgi:hypothetical protein
MGRLWKALNRGDSAVGEIEEARPRLAPLVDAEPMLVDAEEIPFIEVGPQKSIEASPSVLACSPTNRPSAPSGAGPSGRAEMDGQARLARPTETLPVPRSIPFRAVFLATPEMEADTPQTDALSRLILFL